MKREINFQGKTVGQKVRVVEEGGPAKEPDDFYNEANIRYLEELKRLDDEGKLHFVSKTWEELKAMEK